MTKRQKLLDESGFLANPGYATEPLFIYDRSDISASKWRIKEWDYYAVLQPEFGIACVIADLGYSAMISAVFLDFTKKRVIKKTKLLWFVFGKLKLPSSSLSGDVGYHGGGYDFDFIRLKDKRLIRVVIKKFDGEKDLDVDLELKSLKDDSMVIATPFNENPKAFYYNQKINCMPAKGSIVIGKDKYVFNDEQAYGVLDWGRGVWTYKNTWYWASLSGMVNDQRFGFNLGYGFGDTSKASENMIFYAGKSHKLDQVKFEIQEPDFMKPWKFFDNEGRLNLTMEPILDRQDNLNFGIIKNLGHQVFGIFSGTVVLDDGTKLIVDKQLGFAEKITNHY
ncbi:MAG: DUF2804 domain-containing protein [Bacilli bacterium]|nr:DUF2804 domain-containing protein [Bacilli bacterium]MBN2696048.1 DUF2804 domain-containing protein [Bacilli bacterium]